MARRTRFNPLTRIRSSLTVWNPEATDHSHKGFQSPHEDSFFSDQRPWTRRYRIRSAFQSPHEDSFFSDMDRLPPHRRLAPLFQSPHEDSFFSDPPIAEVNNGDIRIVSIPSRGFVLL